jgi:hypothetical protein
MKNLNLLLPILTLAMLSGCSDNKGYKPDKYLFDEYYYAYYNCRNYPTDMTVDTFKYNFEENNTVKITGYRYSTKGGIIQAQEDTVYRNYQLAEKSIYVFMPAQKDDIALDATPIGFSDCYDWRIKSFDKERLIVDFYSWNGLQCRKNIELYANKR